MKELNSWISQVNKKEKSKKKPKMKAKLIKNMVKKSNSNKRSPSQNPKDIGLNEFLKKSIPVGKLLNYFLSRVKLDPKNMNFIKDLNDMAE
mmetsp:Transcript_22785/g.20260  ORF Transcript_22785/g.20260 Transcript_22785/m.20260 type:complete len:91 (+) Transcript_22785:231-503(+)